MLSGIVRVTVVDDDADLLPILYIRRLSVMPRTKKMKRLVRLLILLTLSTSAFSQVKADTSYGLTSEQNKDWLTRVGNANKALQLKLVKGRLFENRRKLNPTDKLDVPLLIIDGIPVDDNISGRQKTFLKNQLTAENVEIKVVEKEPEGLYINKGFTGIILIVITDKKTSRKFERLR